MDRDPKRSSQEGYRLGPDGREGSDGFTPGSDLRRLAYDGSLGRDGYRPDPRNLEPGRDGYRPDPRNVDAGRDGYRPDLRNLEPGRDAYRPAPRNLEPGGDAYRPAPRNREPERDAFRPDQWSFEAGRDSYRGDRQPPVQRPGDRDEAASYSDSRRELLHGPRQGEQESGPARRPLPRLRPDELPSPTRRPQWPDRGREDATQGRADRGPYLGDTSGQSSFTADGREDDTLTRPLPVILPGATSLPRPAPVEAPRGPFEPARPSGPEARPASITGSVEPPPATFSVPDSAHAAPPPRPIPERAIAKLDQIKDLYLTAEAIGEDALDRHFDQVSQRQRELIREFFDRSGPGTESTGG